MSPLKCSRILALLLTISLLACSTGNSDDKKHLRDLKTAYGDRYEISLKWQEYLVLRARDGHVPTDTEVDDIYRQFFSDSKGSFFRSTELIFLNLYDSNGKFVYKLYFDQSSKRLIRSQREEPS
jgi:hypothetical protein